MFKYNYIIEKLTDEQKIKMLTDIRYLSDIELKMLGVPGVNIASLEDYYRNVYPSPVALANSWNTQLIGDVADDIYRTMSAGYVNHAIVPNPKIKINPCRKALSEDPYLASAISGEYLKRANFLRLSTSMTGFYVKGDETEWLDDVPNDRIINNYIVDPYRRAMKMGACSGIISDASHFKHSYDGVNTALSQTVTSGAMAGNKVWYINRSASSDETVFCIVNGTICFSASDRALRAAYKRYHSLERSVKNGNTTVGELDLEIEQFRAISPEMLNKAIDGLLDFAFACSQNQVGNMIYPVNRKQLASVAAQESVVLLKNACDILPLSAHAKVALMGDILRDGGEGVRDESEFVDCFNSLGYECVGFAPGYNIRSEVGDNLIGDAVRLASSADIAVLFLGTTAAHEHYITKTNKLTLPANQLALAEAIYNTHKSVIVVMSGNYAIDIDFAKRADGFILAPLNCRDGVLAAISTITGEINPCGKLTNSLYSNTRHMLEKQHAYRTVWKNKVGPFFGYRYYDTANIDVGYPFGFGLSYTKFAYSALEVNGDTVSFAVKNSGKMAGAEIAQIYVGIEESSVIRPKKELVGFAKIHLDPGQKKTVKLKIELPKIYDTKTGMSETERGNYTVYVASAVNDIRLQKTIFGGNKPLEPQRDKLCDYLQSESNIFAGKYTLEANYKPMKKSAKNLVFGISAFILAVCILAYCMITDIDAVFFKLISAALCVAAVIFFGIEISERNQAREKARKEMDKINKQAFGDAKQVPVFAAGQMFVKEFDSIDKSVSADKPKQDNQFAAEYMAHINKQLTYSKACEEFEAFAAQRGFSFSADTVREIFCAISTSRLIVVRGMVSENFANLVHLLCEYFESPFFMDRIDSSYINEDRVLFGQAQDGSRIKRPIMLAMEAASNVKQNIHFVALDGVKTADISNYFVPFARYAGNPYSKCSISAMNQKNVPVTYYIPENLWFIINLDKDQTLDTLPGYISNIASVNDFEFARTTPSGAMTQVFSFKYYQLDYLSEKIKSYELDEDVWKKIDRFEEYVNSHEPYHIGNKQWLGLEKYAAVFMACDGEREMAIDHAMSARLLPSVVSVLSAKISKEDRGVCETLGNIFGEENVSCSCKVIKDSGADII
ncbi:MAG: hypothetical protein E7667_01695 [Ruminococcaceae bacterium]|nr:hypothetical protein [Oscillospiraceae bacterium]